MASHDDAWPPPRGSVRLGTLDSTRPISRAFGGDRGTPVDRYYIEGFLERHRDDVHGTVLEVGDDHYSRRFGEPRVTRQEVLHVHAGNPAATLVGDLADPAVVRDAAFDCMVVTQTLNLLYDPRPAVARIRAALKPGGVLLATMPGITQVDQGDWNDRWYWSFTLASARRMFDDAFGAGQYDVQTFGNVYAATTFLQGLAMEETDPSKLDVHDPSYPLIVAVRAWKAE